MSDSEHAAESRSDENGIRLDVPDPPDSMSYRDFEDYRNQELLKINGVVLTENAVIAALEHPIELIQSAAAHTIGSRPYRAGVQTLKKHLAAAALDDVLQVEAAYALARLQAPEGKAALEEVLNVPINVSVSPPIAAGYLAQLGDPQGFPVLEKCFATDLEVVRMVACKQIYFFVPFQGQRQATGEPVDALKLYDRALADPMPEIQWQALVQLRELRLPQSRAMLEALAQKTTDQQLSDLAKQIVGTLPSP